MCHSLAKAGKSLFGNDFSKQTVEPLRQRLQIMFQCLLGNRATSIGVIVLSLLSTLNRFLSTLREFRQSKPKETHPDVFSFKRMTNILVRHFPILLDLVATQPTRGRENRASSRSLSGIFIRNSDNSRESITTNTLSQVLRGYSSIALPNFRKYEAFF